MLFASTNSKSSLIDLSEAILHCVAPDGGLYLPASLPSLPKAFINNSTNMSLNEIAYAVTSLLLGDDFDSRAIKYIVDESFNFEIPQFDISDQLRVMELFHGPTLSVKDISTRFMTRICKCLLERQKYSRPLTVLVATTGNSGGSIADAVADLPDVKVVILFPKTSRYQIFDNLNGTASNIRAIEVQGSIDDCKHMIEAALSDNVVRQQMYVTTAGSINIARILPYIPLFFYACARLMAGKIDPSNTPISIPSGNMSLLTAALLAHKMGAPIGSVIAACNANTHILQFIENGNEIITPLIHTLAGSMDVGYPTNMPRLKYLLQCDPLQTRNKIQAYCTDDQKIVNTISSIYDTYNYLVDPHTATAVAAAQSLSPNSKSLIFATAHPAKSSKIVEQATGRAIRIPERLAYCSRLHRHSIKLAPTYPALRKLLLNL